jgi:CBS domain-containing protein
MRPATARSRLRRHRRAPHHAPRLVELTPTSSAAEAIHRLQTTGQTLALVVRSGEVIGVVDVDDLRFALDWAGTTATVADAVTMNVTERARPGAARDVRP